MICGVRASGDTTTPRQADLRQSLRESAQHGARTGVGNDGDAVFHDQRLRYKRSNSNMRWQRSKARGIDDWTSCHDHVLRQIAHRIDRLCQQLRHVEGRAKSEIDHLLVRQMPHGVGQFLTRMDDAHFGRSGNTLRNGVPPGGCSSGGHGSTYGTSVSSRLRSSRPSSDLTSLRTIRMASMRYGMWVPKPWITSIAPLTAAACQPAASVSSCTTTSGCQSVANG